MTTELRRDLFRLGAVQGLDAPQARRLHALAGLDAEPAELGPLLARGVRVLAAALLGLGLVMWVAANWDDFGRAGRFALLQAWVVMSIAGAVWRPAWRAPLALAAFIGIGALFAYFGQTYQTGADAWQLFALWAALGVPLALGARSDVVWAPWALVAAVAVSLWVQTHTGHRWRVEAGDLPLHSVGFALLLGLSGLLAAPLARWTGAGLWALRTAALLAALAATSLALQGLFDHERVAPQYALGVAVLTLAAAGMALTRRGFDLFALSAVALALDVLLVAGLTRLLFWHRTSRGDPIGEMLLLGVVAAGLLALSVHVVMRLNRRAEGGGS